MSKVSRMLADRLLKYLVLLIIICTVTIISVAKVDAAGTLNIYNYGFYDDTMIYLSWSSVGGTDYYNIESTDVNGLNPIAVGTIDAQNSISYNTYTIENLIPETTYYYRVIAYQKAGNVNSTADDIKLAVCGKNQSENPASITTKKIPSPYIFSCKYNINTKKVSIEWVEDTKAELTGIVVAKPNGVGGYTEIPAGDMSVDFPNRELSFSDSTLGLTPQDYVVWFKGTGTLTSIVSEKATVTPVETPTIFAATLGNGTFAIVLSDFNQITKFCIERQFYNGESNMWGDWVIIKSDISMGTDEIVDYPLTGGLYRYRLNAKYNSNYLGYIMTLPVSKLATPNNLSCTVTTAGSIHLTWKKDRDNCSYQRIERRIGSGAYSIVKSDIKETVLQWDDNLSIAANTEYTYRVGSYEYSSSNIGYSNEFTINTSVPNAPTGLNLLIESDTSIKVLWSDNSTNEAGFNIERKEGTGEYKLVGAVPSNVNTFTDNSTTNSADSPKAGKSYTYRVQAKNLFGSSSYSNTISSSDSISPILPSSLTATAASSTQLDLAWTYSGVGKYYTMIERKAGTSGTWLTICTTSYGTVKYSDTGLSANTQYFYRVRNAIGTGVYSLPYPNNDSGVGANTMLSGLPLSGSAASSNRIQLSWSGNSSNTEVIIERKMAGGNFAVLATVPASTVSWLDTTGLIQGASYTYRIKAQNSSNESVYSNEVTVPNIYLEAPSNMVATAGNENKIELTWTDNSLDETGFEIWRYLYGTGSYQLYSTVDVNTTHFTDINVLSGVQYNYMVRAVKLPSNIYSPYTASAGAGIGLLTPPSNLKYSVVTSSQVVLTWTDNSSNESGFRLERKLPEETSWTQIAWLNPNTTGYTLTDLTPYVKYLYRVRVYSYTGNFDSFSNEIEVSTGLPIKPSSIKAEAVSATQINVTWADNANNETSYRIERSMERSTVVFSAEVGPNVTKYADKGLYPNVTYIYKVYSVNKNGAVLGDEVKALTYGKAVFADVTTSISWAKDAIENLAGRGILQGKTPTHFKPNDKITKAEFTAIMMRAFKLDTSTPVGSMKDVTVGRWYYKEVMIAENLGIVSRDSSGRFYPDRAITREEIAVIITKTLAAIDKPLSGYGNIVLEKFWDKNLISPGALSSVASVVGEGVMEGRSATSVAPKDNATRAEAAAMLYKVIDR